MSVYSIINAKNLKLFEGPLLDDDLYEDIYLPSVKHLKIEWARKSFTVKLYIGAKNSWIKTCKYEYFRCIKKDEVSSESK